MPKFNVTGQGLEIEGRGIMPGSVLVLKSDPPGHWQRFGQVAEEKTMTVATPPKPPAEAEKPVRRGRPRRDA